MNLTYKYDYSEKTKILELKLLSNKLLANKLLD